MWKSLAHNEIFGPKSAKYRSKSEETSVDMSSGGKRGEGNDNDIVQIV